MALNEKDRAGLETWFSGDIREVEYFWAEKLQTVVTMYQEMGFSRGEGAIIFMLSSMLGKIQGVHSVLCDIRDELESQK